MSLNSIAASIVNQESGELELGTSNQVRLHIGASGNVGIGTTTPAAALHVVAPTGEVIQDYYNTSNSTPAFVARHARGNLGAGSQTLAEDGLAMIAGEGWHSGGGFSAAYPGIEIVAEQNFTSTAQGSYLAFLTTSLGTNASTEKMRITAGGSLGLGTLTPSERLEVAGSVKAVGFVSTSDARLKRDIHPTAGLEIIRQLTGVDWRWKDTLKKDSGVIAQEVERVMPHAVHTDANSGFKAVKYDALIAPLIQATNELDRMCSAGAVANDRQDRDIASLKEKVGSLEEKNSTLESENEKLKGEVDDMKKRLEKLESLMLKGK